MLRVIVEVLLPLLLPTALYFLWVLGVRRGTPLDWRRLPWLWLAGSGALLLAVALFLAAADFGSRQEGVYVPPRYEGGHIVPGHIEPEPPR